MCISAVSPKTNQALQMQSSLVHHNKGKYALYVVLEGSVHVIWWMPSHHATPLMWSNCKYIAVTRQSETLSTFSELFTLADKHEIALFLQRKCRTEQFLTQKHINRADVTKITTPLYINKPHKMSRNSLRWQFLLAILYFILCLCLCQLCKKNAFTSHLPLTPHHALCHIQVSSNKM